MAQTITIIESTYSARAERYAHSVVFINEFTDEEISVPLPVAHEIAAVADGDETGLLYETDEIQVFYDAATDQTGIVQGTYDDMPPYGEGVWFDSSELKELSEQYGYTDE